VHPVVPVWNWRYGINGLRRTQEHWFADHISCRVRLTSTSHARARVSIPPSHTTGIKTMNAIEVVQRYVDAWNRHDVDSIVAAFAEGVT
jgi:hypothetical protein